MSLLVAILTLGLLGAVILLVSAPLRAARHGRRSAAHDGSAAGAALHPGGRPDRDATLEHDELEAAREAKYREIRDAELDFHTGKLAREDYEAIDRELRAEALQILNRLEQGDAGGGGATDPDRSGDAPGQEDAPR